MKDNNANNSGFSLPIINFLIIIIMGILLLFFSATVNIGTIILFAFGIIIIVGASSIIINIYLDRKKTSYCCGDENLKTIPVVPTENSNIDVMSNNRKIKEYKV